jgi:hypothetical protein
VIGKAAQELHSIPVQRIRESPDWPGLNFIYNAFNRDLMNEGRGMPKSSRPEGYDMTIPQNRQVRDEINGLPEYHPK